MYIMKYIDIPTFIIAFAIGLFFVYVSAPKKQTIFVYPTPDNHKDILTAIFVGLALCVGLLAYFDILVK